EDGADLFRVSGLGGKSEGAAIPHLLRRAKKRSEGAAVQSTADTDPLHAKGGELGNAQKNAFQAHEHVNRTIDGTHHGSNVVLRSETGSIEDVGAGFLKCLKAANGVLQVGAAVQVIFGAGGERKGKWQSAGAFHSGAHALDGVAQFVDRGILPSCCVFDGAANDPGGSRKADSLGHGGGRIAKTVFEVRTDGKIGTGSDRRGIGESLLARERIIAPSESEGVTHAGGGQRLEAQMGQQARAAGIPGIRNDEGYLAFVQGAKGLCFFELTSGRGKGRTHAVLLVLAYP